MSKSIQAEDLLILQLPEGQSPPMDLLLLADPNPQQINTYIDFCLILLAVIKGKTVGVLTMSPETKEKAEIRNIAIAPDYRGKGFSRKLIQDAFLRAARLGYSSVQVCTGNSSTRQFKIYQQFGFELSDVRWNYYTQHFPEPIIEDGIVCKHQLVLSKQLDTSRNEASK
jgi:N-acetylglutamate synthase-like GNAT family acetyltransferase